VLTEQPGRVTPADGQTDADVPAAGGAPAGDALTIRPSRIPAGDSILIEVSWYPGDGRLGGNVGDGVLGNDNPPTCTPAR